MIRAELHKYLLGAVIVLLGVYTIVPIVGKISLALGVGMLVIAYIHKHT